MLMVGLNDGSVSVRPVPEGISFFAKVTAQKRTAQHPPLCGRKSGRRIA